MIQILLRPNILSYIKKSGPFLGLGMSSLHRGHVYFLRLISILSDVSKEIRRKIFISLCNFLYKFVSKLLTNRSFNGATQIILKAFIPNRNIHNNLLFVHEMLTTFSKNHAKRGYMIIKLETEKIYALSEWDIKNKIAGMIAMEIQKISFNLNEAFVRVILSLIIFPLCAWNI